MKKLLIAAAALAVAAAPIAASAAPFGHDGRSFQSGHVQNGGYRGWNGDHRGVGAGGAVAAGLFGLFLGAAIASDHPYYAQPCGWETQAYPGPYGSVQYEQVQVCR